MAYIVRKPTTLRKSLTPCASVVRRRRFSQLAPRDRRFLTFFDLSLVGKGDFELAHSLFRRRQEHWNSFWSKTVRRASPNSDQPVSRLFTTTMPGRSARSVYFLTTLQFFDDLALGLLIIFH